MLEIEFTGDTGEDYRIDFSGTVSSDNPSLDTYLVLKVDTDLQSEFTGGEKAYPLGLVFGAGSSPAVGFGITVYGKFTQGEKVRLHLASSDAGKLTLSDCIMFAVQIRSVLMFDNTGSTLIVSVPVVNEVTSDGIITVLELEQYAWLGMTFGAWFKLGMFIALVLLVIERTLSIRNKWKGK